jgi:hypothetical protein
VLTISVGVDAPFKNEKHVYECNSAYMYQPNSP